MEPTTIISTSSESTGKEIIVQSEDISLANLNEQDTAKALHVKVYRKWMPTNRQGKPILFCCMLIDRQGGAIQANVNLREKNKFDVLLQINKTYRITGFGFQPARTWMQVVPHTLSLVFGTHTDVKAISDTNFPNHYFNFTNHRDLYKKVDVKEGLLTDYIGCVQYITELQQSVKPTKDSAVWRDVGIQNLDSHTIRFTLWNQDAHNFRMAEYEKTEKPAIIAVSSCLVKNYGGLQLSPTAATSYYFNPDIPECHEIRSLYEQFIEPPIILNIQHQRCADPLQERYRNRVTLADLAKENPENQQNVRFTVVATIDQIDTKRPWFFRKCHDCRHKISQRFPHTHCKEPTSESDIIYSYCFRVQLSDGTENVTMTCFSNEANSLIKDCKELLLTIPNKSSYEYPAEVLSLVGKRMIFQLHFDPEGTKENPLFILDTCWDDTPLLTLAADSLPEHTSNASEIKTSESAVETGISTPVENKQPQSTPPIQDIVIQSNTITTHTETTVPTQHIHLTETSKSTSEPTQKTAKRSLFTQVGDASTAPIPKKSKKAT